MSFSRHFRSTSNNTLELSAMDNSQQTQQQREKEGLDLLKDYIAVGFRSDIGQAALSLGYEPELLRSMLNGETPVDEDMETKMRGIAQERNFKI